MLVVVVVAIECWLPDEIDRLMIVVFSVIKVVLER